MAKRARCIWEVGVEYKGKAGGKRRVLSHSQGRVTVLVLDPGADTRLNEGDVLTINHLSMKRWTHNDCKVINTQEAQDG